MTVPPTPFPNPPIELADWPIHRLAPRLRSGELSPAALVEACLARIARTDPALHAFIDLWADTARADAHAAGAEIRAGRWRGPLHGIPVALKDLVEVEGCRTTAGSAFFRDRVSPCTATVARRLVAAGAILIGKLHMVEFAFGGWGINPRLGTPWNPWDPAAHRSPGGSSSGSGVAVAAGMVPAAIGSDTGGSVRIPASLNGVVGLKPTAASVSNFGVFPLSQTLDSIGPLTRSVEDAAIIYQAIRGADPLDAATARTAPADAAAELHMPVAGLRLGVVAAGQLPDVDGEVMAAFEAACGSLSALGAELRPLRLPRAPVDYCRGASQIIRTEAFANLRELIDQDTDAFGPAVRARVRAGRDGLAADYARTLIDRAEDTARFGQAIEGFDALLLPTTVIAAPRLDRIDEDLMPLSDLTRFVNYLGLCALALPAGFNAEGMPLSLQIVGRAFAEPLVLRIGRAFEEAGGWQRRPPLGALQAVVSGPEAHNRP